VFIAVSVASFFLFFVLPARVAAPLCAAIVTMSLYAHRAIARTVQFPPLTGVESMAGEDAVAVTPLDPIGTVRYRGETWRATSSRPLERGTRVRIVRVERQPGGFTAVVEAIPTGAQ
jgi:membrane-bound ClpP family serine protease